MSANAKQEDKMKKNKWNIKEHDHITEWADCAVCGEHLDPCAMDAPEDWDGGCWKCGALAKNVGLRRE